MGGRERTGGAVPTNVLVADVDAGDPWKEAEDGMRVEDESKTRVVPADIDGQLPARCEPGERKYALEDGDVASEAGDERGEVPADERDREESRKDRKRRLEGEDRHASRQRGWR